MNIILHDLDVTALLTGPAWSLASDYSYQLVCGFCPGSSSEESRLELFILFKFLVPLHFLPVKKISKGLFSVDYMIKTRAEGVIILHCTPTLLYSVLFSSLELQDSG